MISFYLLFLMVLGKRFRNFIYNEIYIMLSLMLAEEKKIAFRLSFSYLSVCETKRTKQF